jgi:hypothetical protein
MKQAWAKAKTMFYRKFTREAYFNRIAEKAALCPVSTGSEKQISWAKEIKANAIALIGSALVNEDNLKLAKQIQDAYGDATLINEIEQAKVGLMMFTQIVDAKTLIDLRDKLNLNWFGQHEQNFKSINLAKLA